MIHKSEVPSAAEQARNHVQQKEPDREVPDSALTNLGKSARRVVNETTWTNRDPALRALFAADSRRPHHHALRTNRPLATAAAHARHLFLMPMAIEKARLLAGHLN